MGALAARHEGRGLSLVEALRAVMLDPGLSQFDRAEVGRLLLLVRGERPLDDLLELFFSQSEKDPLYLTALTLETLGDQRAIGPLIEALEDENPHRRHAAARALGWITPSTRRAALALARCLADREQAQPAREEAAESLAYVGTRETIDALIGVLGDTDVRIRFWAVFGLGQSCRGEPRAALALEGMLDDYEEPPGNWWPVRLEALSALVGISGVKERHAAVARAEVKRIAGDAEATDGEKRWAEGHTWV
ncbi:MAG: HEAT repeat domain-containing protein [Bryobacteraceae bacterium]